MKSLKKFLQQEIGGLSQNLMASDNGGRGFILKNTEKPITDQELTNLVSRFYECTDQKILARGSLRIRVTGMNGPSLLIVRTNLTNYRESPMLSVRVFSVKEVMKRLTKDYGD